ncbi:MAG: N-6 DNA methylase [Bacteroidetes bacterium]|nr:N-6 DNA methylase [Bacteroidota bacterium]
MVDNIPTSKYDLIKYYQPIINSFAFSLLNLKEPLFQDVLRILYQIDKELLSDNFPDIFDTILYRIAQSEGKYGGEFIQPVELTRLMCSLAELPPNSNVYNPFAGLASFGVYLDKTQYYFGQEFNKKTWALGTLRLMAHEKLERSTYVCDDSILHWQISREKYDLIIANPPFDSVRQGYEVAPGFRTSIQFLLEKGVESLKADGKLIALLPESFLFRGLQEQRLRSIL